MNEALLNPEPGGEQSPPARHLSVVPTPGKVTDLSKRRRAVDLATLTDVRREMCRVYREVHRGQLQPDQGAKKVYMLATIAKVVEAAEVQPRVDAIERALNRRAP